MFISLAFHGYFREHIRDIGGVNQTVQSERKIKDTLAVAAGIAANSSYLLYIA